MEPNRAVRRKSVEGESSNPDKGEGGREVNVSKNDQERFQPK